MASIKKKNGIKFAEAHINWSVNKQKTALSSDVSKINEKDSDIIKHVAGPNGPKGSLRQGNCKIMIRDCFSLQEIGPIPKIDGIMHRFINIS